MNRAGRRPLRMGRFEAFALRRPMHPVGRLMIASQLRVGDKFLVCSTLMGMGATPHTVMKRPRRLVDDLGALYLKIDVAGRQPCRRADRYQILAVHEVLASAYKDEFGEFWVPVEERHMDLYRAARRAAVEA